MRRRLAISRGGCLSSAWPVRLATALVCLPAWLLLSGCGESAAETGDPDPAQVVLRMREMQQARRYTELGSMIEPRGASAVVSTLMGADRLLDAAGRLQQAAETRLGPRAAVLTDLAPLGNQLGPFSRNVEIVAARVEGDEAIVTYQVDQRVPVERVRLRRAGPRWLYSPEAPDPALPQILLDLTQALTQLRLEVEQDRYDEASFLREYHRRVIAPLQAHLLRSAGRQPAASQP